MPIWGVALIVGLTGLVVFVSLAAIVVGTHLLREREPALVDVEDLSAPLPRETAHALDVLDEHQVEREREREPAVSRRS